jgi:putative salt-induced outer membrane protein YdiY
VRISLLGLILLVWSASVAPCLAQAPPAEPRIWTVALSAGLALTSGNTDTSTVNAAYDLVYNPQTKNVVKSDALFLRGKNESVLTADRLGLNVCDEYSLTTRTFVFGQILGSTLFVRARSRSARS